MTCRKVMLALALLMILAVGCAPAEPMCPEGALTYLPADATGAALQAQISGPAEIPIRGKTVAFAQVVSGALCDAALSGKVYIGCDVQVKAWDTAPNFLDGCHFVVDDGAVITVAAHNGEVFYKGCSACHTQQ